MKTHPVQQITDFEIGDVVRRSSYPMRHHALGGPGTKHVVTGVFPGNNGTHEIPDRVGTLTIEGCGDEHFGHLLFDVPLTEDNLSVEDLRTLLDERTAERDDYRERLAATEAAWIKREGDLDQLRSQLEQTEAALALEARRADRVERSARRLSQVLAYAERLLGKKAVALKAYADGLDAGVR